MDFTIQYRNRISNKVTAIGLAGIVGNVISGIIWARLSEKCSLKKLLTSLVFMDTMIISSVISHTVLPKLYEIFDTADRHYDNFINPYLVYCSYVVVFTAGTASTYLILAMTLERYITVCRPSRYWICSYIRSYVTVALVILFAILFNWTRALEMEVESKYDGHGNFSKYQWEFTKISNTHRVLYCGWLNLFINELIPIAVIIGLNAAIDIELQRPDRVLGTDYWLTVTVEYLGAQSLLGPSICGFIATLDGFNDDLAKTDWTTLVTWGVFFSTLKASINFLTCICVARPFRRTFLDTFCCCIKLYRHHQKKKQAISMWSRFKPRHKSSDTEDTAV